LCPKRGQIRAARDDFVSSFFRPSSLPSLGTSRPEREAARPEISNFLGDAPHAKVVICKFSVRRTGRKLYCEQNAVFSVFVDHVGRDGILRPLLTGGFFADLDFFEGATSAIQAY
jgi:hypothetical protein